MMATRYLELFSALAAPFPEEEVKVFPPSAGKMAGKRYVTVRTVQNRLDDVLGPESWWDDYRPTGRHESQHCRLTIRLPDGSILTKSDAGGESAVLDDENGPKAVVSDALKRAAVKFGIGGESAVLDDENGPKAVVSDALKRAAVKFGIGREFYGDGVADLTRIVVGSSQDTRVSSPTLSLPVGSDSPPSLPPRPMTSIQQPGNGRALLAWSHRATAQFGLDLEAEVRAWGAARAKDPAVTKWDVGDVTDCMADMARFLDSRGLLKLPPEAREQMVARTNVPVSSDRGPLQFDDRDPLYQKKLAVAKLAKHLFVQAFPGEEPQQERVMEFIQTRCKDHKIIPPESIRNLSVSEHVGQILLALREDYEDMRRVS
jgi:hypothetical protein